MTARMQAPAPPTTADVERLAAKIAARLEVGHETTCTGCGGRIVRVVAASSRLRFGEAAYAHPGYFTCPGRPPDGPGDAAKIVRSGP